MPARASARDHAMLPVTSSSKRRRSKRKEEPNSNAAASGAVSKRPDQRFDMIRSAGGSRPPALGDSSAGEAFEAPREGGGAARVAGDDEDRVVAANRADGFGELRAI